MNATAVDNEKTDTAPAESTSLKKAQEQIPIYLLALSKARMTSLSREDLITLSREILKETEAKYDSFTNKISLDDWVYLSCLRSHTRFLDRKIRNECLHFMIKKPELCSSSSTKSKFLLDRLHSIEESMRLFCSSEELPDEDRLLFQKRYQLGLASEKLAEETNTSPQDMDKRLDTISQKLSLYWPDMVSPWDRGSDGKNDGSQNGDNGQQASETAPLVRIGEVLENEGKLRNEVSKALHKNHMERSKINAALQEMFGEPAEGTTKSSGRGQRSLVAAALMAVAIFISTIFQASSDNNAAAGSNSNLEVRQASTEYSTDMQEKNDTTVDHTDVAGTVPPPITREKEANPKNPLR